MLQQIIDINATHNTVVLRVENDKFVNLGVALTWHFPGFKQIVGENGCIINHHVGRDFNDSAQKKDGISTLMKANSDNNKMNQYMF